VSLLDLKALISYIAVRKASFSGVAVGRELNLSRSGVCLAARRGEAMIEETPEIGKKLMEKGGVGALIN